MKHDETTEGQSWVTELQILLVVLSGNWQQSMAPLLYKHPLWPGWCWNHHHERATQLHMVDHMRMIRDTLRPIGRFPSQGVACHRVRNLTQQLGLQESAVQRGQGHAQDLKATAAALMDFHLRDAVVRKSKAKSKDKQYIGWMMCHYQDPCIVKTDSPWVALAQ